MGYRKYKKDFVKENLAKLPLKQQIVAEKFYVEGKSTADVAKDMGLSSNQVKNILRHANQKLALCEKGLPVFDKRKATKRDPNGQREIYRDYLIFLPEKQKMIMTYWLQGKNEMEIAQEIGKNVGTVSKQISCSCAKLDKYISGEEKLPEIKNGKPVRLVETKCSTKFISDHLVYLNPSIRKFVEEHFIEKHSIEQIAQEHGLKKNTASYFIYKGKNTLEGYLSGKLPLPVIKNNKPFSYKRKRDWDNQFVLDNLNKLSNLQGKAAELYYVQGMSYEEVAQALNTTRSCIITSVRNAKIKLDQIKNGTFAPKKLSYAEKYGYDKEYVLAHLHLLSRRQAQVAQGIFIEGKKGAEIARELSIAPVNIKYALDAVKRKFDKAMKMEKSNEQ